MTKRFNNNKIIGTANLNKIFKFKINYNKHNSLNDCFTISKTLKVLIKNYGKKEFNESIAANNAEVCVSLIIKGKVAKHPETS